METNSIDDKIGDQEEDSREGGEQLEQILTRIELPKETLDYFNGDELRARVFYEKYALKDKDGIVVERTPADMWGRIAHELASVEVTEDKRREWEKKFFWLLENFRFVPGGRIMFGAGQSRKSTLLNCLRGDTTVLVNRQVEVKNSVLGYGNSVVTQTISVANTVEAVRVKEIVGQRVEVLTPLGWSRVNFESYGKQPLYRIALNNGDYLYATGNHEWVIRSNKRLVKKTTKELITYKGDTGLAVFLPSRPVKNEKYYEGIVHGIVFGDGSRNLAKYCKTYSVWLFGAQRELAKYLPHAHEYTGQQPVLRGALLGGGIRSQYELKKLPPVSESSSYWYGFVCGYIATNGWVHTLGNSAGTDSCNIEDLEIIKSQLGRIGLLAHKISIVRKDSPYDGSSSPLYRLSFWKASISEDLFLRSDHLAKFKRSDRTKKVWTIGIQSIEETGYEEEVFCCNEPLTNTFVLGNGILTGNCYYLPIKTDSLESIFDFCKEAGRTYSFGGGVGTDISILRPKGAPVNNSAIVSTGSVSFMELFSVTTGTIGQAGRRGALMITIHVDHPDVVDFIDVKRDISKVTHANISVCITDKFMQAVENDEEFELAFKNEKADVKRIVRARELWDKLVSSAHASAEPGIIFWDNVKKESPTEYNGMEVHGFNPCSEQCLEDYGCCCLGNINLAVFVVDEFSSKARLDWRNLEKAVRYGTRFLDNVLDYNSDKHPLPEQTRASLLSRRIGLGFTGLADMLIKLNLKYDSPQSAKFIDRLFEKIKNICYDESANLATEKGAAPGFVAEKHLSRPFVSRLEAHVREKIGAQGIRNCCLLTVPPVGSGAILAGTTSGIEPIFALSYIRKSKSLSGGEFKVYHPLVQEYMKRFQIKSEGSVPDTFVTAHKIKAESRVLMQGTIQKHIDSSISSTVNIPRETTVEEVKKIYVQAWKMGCKGITVYREGAREGILVTEAEAAKQKGNGLMNVKAQAFERSKILTGQTIKMKLPQGNLYVTANRNESDAIRETFVTLGKSGGDEKANAEAMGRLISLFLQHGGDIRDVIHSLQGIQGRDVSWDNGQQLLSVPDAVAKALSLLSGAKVENDPELRRCPDCGESGIIFENGCYRCTSCGYSKCN
jgi:ribonucleoside-diphosphate reductase alpha chain